MSYRIVVADKDPASREAVARFLSQQDADFVSVSSSGELKQAIKSRKPDLIIVNAVLSDDAPGWKVSKGIKGSRDYADVPVLLMTGDPGSPSAEEIKTSLADDYLTKPINGSSLRRTVASLLGISAQEEGEGEDEELVIDFSDDESGNMTEELLAISSDALGAPETTTDVGDTVEIDAGTLSAEVEGALEVDEDEEYGDTVRLNLDDIGLEEYDQDAPALEPTIELTPDVPTEVEEPTFEKSAQPGVEAAKGKRERLGDLPDFSSLSPDVRDTAPSGKDSVTVDLDVDDLSLELTEDLVEEAGEHEVPSRFDADDTEIGKLLEVQKPSEIITSEDVMVQDDSLISEPFSDAQIDETDIIELEEDAEIADIETEQLEAIDAESLLEPVQDFDTATVPVASVEMEKLAQGDLEEITLEDAEETTLTAEHHAPTLEIEDELSLEEISGEEILTEEFFGEELPTEEFPTERLPKAETEELSLEQEISLEGNEAGEFGLVPDKGAFEEITLDTDSAKEILAEYRQEEPVLEVTEDISLEEVSLEEEPLREPVPPAVRKPTPRPEEPPLGPPAPSSPGKEPLGPAVLAGVAAAAAAVTRPGAAPVQPVAPVASAVAGPPTALQGYVPTREDWMAAVNRRLGELLPARDEFKLAGDTEIRQTLPGKEELAEMFEKILREALPSRNEMAGAFEQAISASLPDQETILLRIDQQVTACLPSQEQIFRRIDDAVKGFLPSSEMLASTVNQSLQGFLSGDKIMERITAAIANVIPSTEDVSHRLESALVTAIPTKDQVEAKFWSSLEGKIERLVGEIDLSASIAQMLPKADDMLTGLREALPDKERFQETVAKGLVQAIENSLPERVWLESVSRGLFDERTKALLPDRQEIVALLRDEIRTRLLDTVEKIVKEQIEKITADLAS